MARTSSDILIETIANWGVDTIFGVPGDGINGIIEALRTHQDHVRFIHTRHEEGAAFMACAYAKYTGRLGCCVGTSGQHLAWELGNRLPANAIVSCDSGTVATWWARQVRVKKGQMHSLSGTLATMANGLPYTIAAQVAHPDRPCFAFVGDGGFSMLMAELATAVKYHLPIKVFIIDNHTLGQIKWEQMVLNGNPEYGCGLQPIDFARFAEACGATGLRLEEPEDTVHVIEEAIRTPGPVVVDAIVDPLEPPMPPKVSARQAGKFTEAMLKGEPNRSKIALTIAKDKVRELI